MYKENVLLEEFCVMINEVNNSMWMTGEHWHNYFELLYIIDGEITQILDNHIEAFGKKDIILIAPKTVHSTFSKSPHCKILVLQFQSSFYSTLGFNDISLTNEKNEFSTELENLFHEILDEKSKYKYGYKDIIKADIIKSLVYILRLDESKCKNNKDYKQMMEIVEYIDENIEKRLLLSDCAKRLGYTAEHLSVLIKKNSGYSFKPYVENAKIALATRYLLFEKMPINEIATKLGYADTTTFSRAFKRVVGKSPKKYMLEHKS